MVAGILLILAGVLLVIYPPLLSIIVALFLILAGAILIATSRYDRRHQRRFENPTIDRILRF